MSDVAMWSKSHPSWGKRRRIQRNNYAYLVTIAFVGMWGVCPTCEGDMTFANAEVDRAIPSLDYRPGNCLYICHACNHGRGILQSEGRDWTRAQDYARDVARASERVRIPSEREAGEWWARMTGGGSVSRYA